MLRLSTAFAAAALAVFAVAGKGVKKGYGVGLSGCLGETVWYWTLLLPLGRAESSSQYAVPLNMLTLLKSTFITNRPLTTGRVLAEYVAMRLPALASSYSFNCRSKFPSAGLFL